MRGALEQTAKILRESEYIVFLGGAGAFAAAQISNGLQIPIHFLVGTSRARYL